MKKTKVYLDLDGTILDLYSVPQWLDKLKKEESGLFENLNPLVAEKELLKEYPIEKYDIRILTMLPKGASEDYKKVVTLEKKRSLEKHFPYLSTVKQIYMNYGSNKNLKNSKNAILIDDNEDIRKSWKGLALYPSWL